MTVYVARIDDGRLWVDAQMRALLATLTAEDAAVGPDAPAPNVGTNAPAAPETPATE